MLMYISIAIPFLNGSPDPLPVSTGGHTMTGGGPPPDPDPPSPDPLPDALPDCYNKNSQCVNILITCTNAMRNMHYAIVWSNQFFLLQKIIIPDEVGTKK